MRTTNKSAIKNNNTNSQEGRFLHKAGGEAKAKANLFESVSN